MTAQEAKDALLIELSKGHEVIPMGKCDNFDYKTGCKGHEEKPINKLITVEEINKRIGEKS